MKKPEMIENIRVVFGDELVLEREVIEDGKTYRLFVSTYTDRNGQEFEVCFHAENHDDAAARVEAIRETLELDGEWGGNFTQEQAN